MKAKGPREERETIIIFSDESDLASIWTASQVVYNRLKKRYFPAEDGERHAVFAMPKGDIRVHPKRKGRKNCGFQSKKKPENS